MQKAALASDLKKNFNIIITLLITNVKIKSNPANK